MYFTQFGYDNYDDYLQGTEWQIIHDLFYNSPVPYRCTLCHQPAKLFLHKRSYAHLDVPFFRELVRKRNWRLLKKILSWKCPRCNDLCHFYDKKKTKKVELDYLFLWERERRLYWRLDLLTLRIYRTTKRSLYWVKDSFSIGQRRQRFAY